MIVKSFSLDEKDFDYLRSVSNSSGVSDSEIVREAIRLHEKKGEGEARKKLNEVRKSLEKFYK